MKKHPGDYALVVCIKDGRLLRQATGPGFFMVPDGYRLIKDNIAYDKMGRLKKEYWSLPRIKLEVTVL